VLLRYILMRPRGTSNFGFVDEMLSFAARDEATGGRFGRIQEIVCRARSGLIAFECLSGFFPKRRMCSQHRKLALLILQCSKYLHQRVIEGRLVLHQLALMRFVNNGVSFVARERGDDVIRSFDLLSRSLVALIACELCPLMPTQSG
jgi:hypothetical protein